MTPVPTHPRAPHQPTVGRLTVGGLVSSTARGLTANGPLTLTTTPTHRRHPYAPPPSLHTLRAVWYYVGSRG